MTVWVTCKEAIYCEKIKLMLPHLQELSLAHHQPASSYHYIISCDLIKHGPTCKARNVNEHLSEWPTASFYLSLLNEFAAEHKTYIPLKMDS